MADMIISAGGGGAGSDDCTATKAQVLSGYTAVTKDSDDEPVEGAMANRGAVTQALNAGGSYTVPAGYHNGSGKVTANSLASQTGGATAGDGDVLTGKTYWKDGTKRTGSMANQGAKTSALNCGGSYTIPAGYHNGSGKVTANSLSSQTSATSGAGDIRSGKTAWVNGSKLTGTLAVTSAISFSAAALSYNTIRISWTNPAKGPWQGVFIQMSTSGSPGTGGGSRAYTGAGNNPNQAGGSNYVDIGGLSPGTVYYFTCTSYCDNLGWGSSHNISVKTKLIDLRDVFNVAGVSRYIVISYKDSYESHEETYYYNRYMRSDFGLRENVITTSSSTQNDSSWGSWRDGDPMRFYLKYSADVEPTGVIAALQQYKRYNLFANTHMNSPESYARTYTGTVTVSWTKMSGAGLNNSGYWIVFTLDITADSMSYDMLYYELTLLP